MNDKKTEIEPTLNPFEEPAHCGPGCNCSTTGLSMKGKVIIFCLVVIIALAVAVSRGFTRKAENETAQGQQGFTPVASALASPAKAEKTPEETQSSLWGEPLKDLVTLNNVAAEKDAVLLYLPEKERGPDKAVKRQIESAADKAQSGGYKMALYMLETGSKDYDQLTSQVPAPCVLAMVKGRGMSQVSGEISEGKLLQAIIAASRSGGCSPAGCGSSSPNCNK